VDARAPDASGAGGSPPDASSAQYTLGAEGFNGTLLSGDVFCPNSAAPGGQDDYQLWQGAGEQQCCVGHCPCRTNCCTDYATVAVHHGTGCVLNVMAVPQNLTSGTAFVFTGTLANSLQSTCPIPGNPDGTVFCQLPVE
jgi:hypothetical protein